MASRVEVPGRDGAPLPAIVAEPSGPARLGVVVLHEIFGPTEHFADLCDRLAALDCIAVAPDLWSRHPDIARSAGKFEIVPAVQAAGAIPQEAWLADVAAAADAIGARAGDVPVILLAFCIGGYIGLSSAAQPDAPWSGAVIFYAPPSGYLPTGAPSVEPDASNLAGRIGCPLLVVHGARDSHVPLGAVEEFVRRRVESGGDVELVVEDAGHAFFNDTLPAYDEPAARDAWEHVRAFIGRTTEAAGSPR